MACPLCGDECRCPVLHARRDLRERASFSHFESQLDDTDAIDRSEEQFFASVAHRDMNDTSEVDETGFQMNANHRARTRFSHARGEQLTHERTAENAASDGEPALSARDEVLARLRSSGVEREFAAREALEHKLQHMAEIWRQEVANRVEGYRTRRSKKRLSGEFSMKLDFEHPPRMAASAAAREPEPDPMFEPEPMMPEQPDIDQFESAVARPAAQEAPGIAEAEAAEEWLPMPPLPGKRPVSSKPPASVKESKVIEFPRSLLFPEEIDTEVYSDDLAESMQDKPRILDVPDTISVSAPPLADVALEHYTEDEPAPQPTFDLPLQVAALPQRFTAALVDWLIVITATGVFGMMVAHWAPGLPHTKPIIGLALAMPVFFWAVYYYLFLVHAATTPGMQMARIRMSGFDRDRVPRHVRRYRALVMVLSCVSLGFGFLWALFDEDNLCWHDRMTRTYLTTER